MNKVMHTSPMLNRRQFTSRLMAGLAGSALFPAAAFTEEDATATPRYVDIHTHLGQAWGVQAPLPSTRLLDWMDAKGVMQAVVLPLVSPEAWAYPLSTDYVLRETLDHRDRLIPFCSIDPRTIGLDGKQGIVDLLKKYVDAGCRGFGEHKAGVPIDDDRNMLLFESIAEVGLPVLFHLDNSRNMDQPGLPGLEKVLKSFPNLVMIGHAQGFWASIDGGATQADLHGYPKRPVEPGGALDRLFQTYPNLYGDLSAGSGANAISRDLTFGRDFVIRNSERLLFGTDYLQDGQAIPQFELYDSLELPAEVQSRVFRTNAKRLLGLTVA